MKIFIRVVIITLLCTLAIIIFLYRPRPIISNPYDYYLLGVFYGSGIDASHLRGAPAEELYETYREFERRNHPRYGAEYTHLIDADELLHLISQTRMRRQLPVFHIGGSGEWFIYLRQRGNQDGTIRLMVGNRNVAAQDSGGIPMRIVRGHALEDALVRMVWE